LANILCKRRIGSSLPVLMADIKKIIIIAGPNGAGKTTFAREFLPTDEACLQFVNADLIAAGLSPFAPEAAAILAGRLMLSQIADHLKHGRSFALETTLSGLSYARKIAHWRAAGYAVALHFLALPNAEMAIERVAQRVRQGGHDIPAAVIRRRFAAGLANLPRYCALVDVWDVYDNSGLEPVLLNEGAL
jgi:predicted ABC-type ATPase